MFTLKQIEDANSKVKSGADFPKLVRDLISIGVIANDVYVSDGHADYFGEDDFRVTTAANYPVLEIADTSDGEKFREYLKIHQEGKTDYPTFCRHSAETGVEKWRLDFAKMTCTYFDRSNNVLLVEKIPGI
ncbi:MAG: DUF1398 family protein [Acidobacteria bacterium]|nr:DUF1398 family protein [Acidobacteriota bacterium]